MEAWQKDVHTMKVDEPVEIILSSPRHRETYQVIASVSSRGVVHYNMQTVPGGNYSHALTYLHMDSTTPLPRKAVAGWQKVAVEVLGSGFYDVQKIT